MSGGPFNPVKDLASAESRTPFEEIKTQIANDSASITLLFGGNPVEGSPIF